MIQLKVTRYVGIVTIVCVCICGRIANAEVSRISSAAGLMLDAEVILCVSAVVENSDLPGMNIEVVRYAFRITHTGNEQRQRLQNVFRVTENASVSSPGAIAWPARSGFLVCDDHSISLLAASGKRKVLYRAESEMLPVHLEGSKDGSYFAWANRPSVDTADGSIRIYTKKYDSVTTDQPRFVATALTGESVFFAAEDGMQMLGFIDENWAIRKYNLAQHFDRLMGKVGFSPSAAPRVFTNGTDFGIGSAQAKLVLITSRNDLVFSSTPPGEPVLLGGDSEWTCVMEEEGFDATTFLRQKVRDSPSIESFNLPAASLQVTNCGDNAMVAWNSSEVYVIDFHGRVMARLGLESLRRQEN